MSDIVWIISTAQADGMAVISFPPTSSQAAMQRSGRILLPPARREYRMDSWIFIGCWRETAASKALFTEFAFSSM